MNPKIIYPSDYDFASYLESAAIKRFVVEFQLKASPDKWKKVFIDKVSQTEGQLHIRTTKGLIIREEEILGLITPFDDLDADAISCLCH